MTARNRHGVGPRCATWLKELYPNHRGKLIARDFDVSESTVWRWLAGEAPTVRILEEMSARWGRPFLEYVFAGQDGPAGDDLQRLIAIRAELDRREEAAREEEKRKPRPEVQYSRAVREDPEIPSIDWTDTAALQRTPLYQLNAAMTRLLGQRLAADPGLSRTEKSLITLKALLRIG
ncbi:hypothetical protein [Alsobacter sp. R-9]